MIIASACTSAAGSSSSPSNGGAAAAATTGATGAAAVAPAGVPDAGVIGAPALVGTGTVTGGGGSSAALAYPYPGYPGASGVAADHTIVVTGAGDAAIKADGSNRASAQRTALAAALADAKAQADLVAQATGVTIKGVLSVSVANGQMYVYPMAAGAEGSAPGAAPGGTTVAPPAPGVVQPVASRLEVSVTIAYQIG
ncbi:MAG TPA: SIMPL domain-containing protein [Candidatus Bathyarchaeia archaeon]|nr:SIMPL domain-containing protein [Candidatus Bathyarchaeia archaeon]